MAQEKRTVAAALKFDPETGETPTVVAERILDLAFAAGVKVRRDADLAEMLAAIDPDTEIPPEAFAAVAEILSYIYELNASAGGGETP